MDLAPVVGLVVGHGINADLLWMAYTHGIDISVAMDQNRRVRGGVDRESKFILEYFDLVAVTGPHRGVIGREIDAKRSMFYLWTSFERKTRLNVVDSSELVHLRVSLSLVAWTESETHASLVESLMLLYRTGSKTRNTGCLDTGGRSCGLARKRGIVAEVAGR
ncbi:MAG: hypothetical protein AAF092_18420, partial [Pseudomonadota bacterium]